MSDPFERERLSRRLASMLDAEAIRYVEAFRRFDAGLRPLLSRQSPADLQKRLRAASKAIKDAGLLAECRRIRLDTKPKGSALRFAAESLSLAFDGKTKELASLIGESSEFIDAGEIADGFYSPVESLMAAYHRRHCKPVANRIKAAFDRESVPPGLWGELNWDRLSEDGRILAGVLDRHAFAEPVIEIRQTIATDPPAPKRSNRGRRATRQTDPQFAKARAKLYDMWKSESNPITSMKDFYRESFLRSELSRSLFPKGNESLRGMRNLLEAERKHRDRRRDA